MATLDYYSSNTRFRSRWGFQNAKDSRGHYVANSEYEDIVAQVTPVFAPLSPAIFAYNLGPSEHITPGLTNKLYGKLREELVGPKGELLTSAVEWKTSLDMISGRARQLGSAFLAIKRFQFKKAAKILRIATPAKYKNLSRKHAQRQGLSPTGLWLEYWMGWAPLVGDIANAMQTLSKGPPESRHFRVGVRRLVEEIHKIDDPRDQWTWSVRKVSGIVSYSAYGEVSVINHNRNLFSQLGLTNPALTLFQILPFSFMVNWFVNAETFLGSLTDFESLSITNTGTAMKSEGFVTVNGVQWAGETYYELMPFSQRGVYSRKFRSPGVLPTPQLRLVMLDKLSLTRAATSISLLVEIFLRKK